jgi:N-acetylmuramoyl-L-alanine amidase
MLTLLAALVTQVTAQPLVMIDPGHGGRDSGVIVSGGLSEKALMLDLAQCLAAALRPRCRTALTRNQDQTLAIEARAAAANRADAALLISLHAGASIDSRMAFQNLFYHQWPETPSPTAIEKSPDAAAWDHIQDRHTAQSRHLAETLAYALAQTPNLPLPLLSQVRAAPLSLLKGADMPAVVVELGHLTHPLMADWLNDPLHQEQLAQTLAQALTAFLGVGLK